MSIAEKIQEYIDGLASSDPVTEMGRLEDADTSEAAMKWLALAALHAFQFNAKKITLINAGEGVSWVRAKYRTGNLPTPPSRILKRIFDEVGKDLSSEAGARLSLRIQDREYEIEVRLARESDMDKLVLKFPKAPK